MRRCPRAAPLHQPGIRAAREGEIPMQAKVYALAISLSLGLTGVAQAQRVLSPPEPAPVRAAPPAAAAAPASIPAAAPATRVADPACTNPNALGVSRTVEID